MNSLKTNRRIFYGVVLVLLGYLLYLYAANFYLVNEALHSSVEAMGALCALILAALIFQIKKHTALKYYYVWIVCALISMGLLDLFHALVMPGELFVWLHSTATFIGGLFFAMVWLPERAARSKSAVLLPGAVFAASLIFGMASLAIGDAMPGMLQQGGFTWNAYLLNITGGFFFVAASIWFFKDYRRTRSTDELLFAFLCLLFGAAGIIFVFSKLWDPEWWLWHAIRMAAYLLLLFYSFNAYKELGDELEKAKGELEEKIKERTAELASTVGLLRNEVAEREKTEEKLKESLREKEVLMREIYHRVKNNMTVVSSLLSVQSRQVDDVRYRAMFDDSVNRLKLMASIHEKLYQSENVSKIIFSTYIKDMANNIFNSYGPDPRIKFVTDIKEVMLDIDTSVHCGLIVNELITNSMKYAFPDGREGKIKVSLYASETGEVQVTVSDNGVGMPEGLDFRNTDSMGLSLVNALVGQLQGNIQLNREKGTEFVITFKPIAA